MLHQSVGAITSIKAQVVREPISNVKSGSREYQESRDSCYIEVSKLENFVVLASS